MNDMSITTKTSHLKKSDPKRQFVNFTIRTAGALFPVHKVYLAEKSPFFDGMFENDKLCKEYEITEHSIASVEACVLYIYTEELRIDPRNVRDVASLSQLLGMEQVTTRCENFLKDNLNQSNCIQMKKDASERSLNRLAEAVNTMILTNANTIAKNKTLGELSSDDIRSLRNTAPNDTKNVWMIFQGWAKFTEHKVCEATKVIPFGDFTINSFKNAVWKHDHIYNCDDCKVVAAHQFLQCTKEIPDGTSPDDLLFLKNLAKLYSFKEVEEMTYKFIEQHPNEFISPCLIELFDTDEILGRLANMETQCTQSIFLTLVQWIGKDPARQGAFKFIFKYAEHPHLEAPSTFLSSINAFVGLSEWCEADKSSDVDGECWFPQHSLLLKCLAKSYEYTRIERLVDACIIGDFARVSHLPDFVNLSVEDLKKYVSSLPTYDYGAKPVWDAVMRWVNHDYDRRQEHFEDIFTALKLDKFGSDLLQTDVVMHELVVNSNLGLALIIRRTMSRND